MKKKLLISIIALSFVLSACGNKDDGPKLISAGDSANSDGSDSSYSFTDDSTEETEEVEEETEEVEEETDNIVTEEVKSILGTWSTTNGDIFEFKKAKTIDGSGNIEEYISFGCYLIATNENLSGTCETDGSTYITVHYTTYEQGEVDETNVDEEGNVIEPEVETVEHNIKYTIESIDSIEDSDNLTMVIKGDDNSEYTLTSVSLDSNSEDTSEVSDEDMEVYRVIVVNEDGTRTYEDGTPAPDSDIVETVDYTDDESDYTTENVETTEE
jgi:hypothetical protein